MTDNTIAGVSSAVPYLRFQLKLFGSSGALVKSLNTGKQRKLHTTMARYEWASAELVVRYSADDPTLRNDAICDSPEELRQAITAFTEPELLEYVRGGKWGRG